MRTPRPLRSSPRVTLAFSSVALVVIRLCHPSTPAPLAPSTTHLLHRLLQPVLLPPPTSSTDDGEKSPQTLTSIVGRRHHCRR
jgi:hypothetical protein